MTPNPLGKITKFDLHNNYLKFNNNPYPSINIFASILDDNNIVINSHPSQVITGKEIKVRALTVGGGLLQSPYKPCSFSITTTRFRHIIYKRTIFGFEKYYYELFDLLNDRLQLNNLWELQTDKRKSILIKYYRKNIFSKKHILKPSFYFNNKNLKFSKSRLSKTARYWIFKSIIGSILIRLDIMKSRIKDRLIYLIRSGYHLNK